MIVKLFLSMVLFGVAFDGLAHIRMLLMLDCQSVLLLVVSTKMCPITLAD